MTLADLCKGQKATITKMLSGEVTLKLLEMGCVPGEIVFIEKIAPLGDPIAINISGHILSLRKDEASSIIVHPN